MLRYRCSDHRRRIIDPSSCCLQQDKKTRPTCYRCCGNCRQCRRCCRLGIQPFDGNTGNHTQRSRIATASLCLSIERCCRPPLSDCNGSATRGGNSKTKKEAFQDPLTLAARLRNTPDRQGDQSTYHQDRRHHYQQQQTNIWLTFMP